MLEDARDEREDRRELDDESTDSVFEVEEERVLSVVSEGVEIAGTRDMKLSTLLSMAHVKASRP